MRRQIWIIVGTLVLAFLVAGFFLIVDPNDPTDCANYDDYVEVFLDDDQWAAGLPPGQIVCP